MRLTHAGPPRHPRLLWYWVAGFLLAGAVSCIVLGAVGFFGLDHQIHDFQRVPVPGHAMVTFTRPGGYVIYVERPGSCCQLNIGNSSAGEGASPPFPRWPIHVALQPASGGPAVPLSPWRGVTESYAAAGRQGQAALSFTIDRPGQYYLAVSDLTPRSITDIAAGRGIGHDVFIPVLLLALGFFAFAPSGLVVGTITAVRRNHARRALVPAPWNPAAPPDAPAWPAPPPGSLGWQSGPAVPPASSGWQAGPAMPPPPTAGRPVPDDRAKPPGRDSYAAARRS